MTRYTYKDAILTIHEGKGRLYISGRLKFMGDGYVAIKFLMDYSNNAPEVREKFKAQLTMREAPKFRDDKKTQNEVERPKEEPKKVSPPKKNKLKDQWNRLTS